MTRRLLLLSSARDGNGVFLLHSSTAIRTLLGPSVHSVLLIPYAGVTILPERYAERAAVPFAKLGYELRSITEASDPVEAVESAQAIVVGGGNTFRLLASLYDRELLEPIRARVHAGGRTSAGARAP
jgi:dipeptidase E